MKIICPISTMMAAITLFSAPYAKAEGPATSLEIGHASGTLSSNGGLIMPGITNKPIDFVSQDSGTALGFTIEYNIAVNEQFELGPVFRANWVMTSVSSDAEDAIASFSQADPVCNQCLRIGDDSVNYIVGFIGPQAVYRPLPYLRATAGLGLGYGVMWWNLKIKDTVSSQTVHGANDEDSFYGMAWGTHLDVAYSITSWFHVGPSITMYKQSLADKDDDVEGDATWWLTSLNIRFAK